MLEHEYLEYLPAYAAGALDGESKRNLETHLDAGCAICDSEILIFNETIVRLPFSLPQQKLPSDLKEKIWKRIEAEEKQFEAPSATPAGTSFARRAAGVAKIAAVLILLFAAGMYYLSQNDRVYEKEKTIADLQKELRSQRKAVQAQQQEISWLRDPSVQLAMLTGLDPAPNASGKMVWSNQQSKGIFYANALPALSQGKTYQLWVIGNKGPVSAGVFDPDAAGSAVVTISRIASPAEGTLQFAVTVEPVGGLPQPSGSMVLAGKPL